MNLSKSEYEDLIRKKPSLKPTEAIKAQNTHKYYIPKCSVRSPWVDLIENPPSNIKVTIIQEKPSKTPPVLKFTIPGQPVGKPRMTIRDKWFKRPCVVKYWAWADKARANVPRATILSLYREIHFVAYLEIPKSYSMTRRHILAGNPHQQKPDVDNIAKSCGDALFPEDKFIWKVSGEKRWDDGKGSRIEVELK